MRPSTPALLYFASLALLGGASWLFWHATPKLGGRQPEEFQQTGLNQGGAGLQAGRGRGGKEQQWNYHALDWWMQFRDVDVLGTVPRPVEQPGPGVQPSATETQRPLADIIELVALVSDWREQGRTPDSSIVVRYKPAANIVAPPEEVARRALLFARANAGPDVLAQPAPHDARRGRRPPGNQPATALPVAAPSDEWIQYVKVGETLWGQYADIELVRVAAESAWFVRRGAEGLPAEEQLDKGSFHLSAAVRDAIQKAGGQVPVPSDTGGGAPGSTQWVPYPTTRELAGVWQVGTDDELQFREHYEDLLASVNLDTYRSPYDPSLRGVRIANIDPALATRFGLTEGEVILAVNGEPVQGRSELLSVGKRQYARGTRTFVVKFLTTAGEIVERTYQAPDRR